MEKGGNRNMKKYFKIPVEWACYGVVEIYARNIDEAIKITKEDNNIPLPEGDYIDGSWQVNEDEALIKALNERKIKI